MDKYYIFIHALYFKAKNNDMTKDEQVAVRGLGKKIMCRTLQLIETEFRLNSKKTLVMLEASGSLMSHEQMIEFTNELKSKSKKELNEIINHYDFFKDKNISNYDIDDISSLIQNNELANYYNRNYGFKKLLEPDIYVIFMANSLENCIQTCKRNKII